MSLWLNPLQAFNAAVKFLDHYYRTTASDDVAALLGDMSFLPDDSTADEAAWYDWLDALGTDKPVDSTQAYNSVIRFLTYYATNTSSDEIKKLVDDMSLGTNAISKNPAFIEVWQVCVAEVLREPEGSRYYLQLK